MNSRQFLTLWLMGCATAACSAAVAEGGADAPPSFKACLDSDNPPFSTSAGPSNGIDVEVASALAEHMDRPLRVVWVEVPNRGGIGKALRNSLVAGACDAYFSVPQAREMGATMSELKLVSTQPYLTVGYAYVSAPGQAAPTAQSLRRANRIGAVTATPADLYLHEQQLRRYPYPNSQALLNAVQTREVDVALVWSPALALSTGLLTSQTAPTLVEDPALQVGLSIAVVKGKSDLLQRLNEAISALAQRGVLKDIARRHRLAVITQP